MKTSIHHKRWQPGCYITPTGYVCTPLHILQVLCKEEARAAREATAAIYRMMKS